MRLVSIVWLRECLCFLFVYVNESVCFVGWWYVLSRDKNGWFPASYLEMIDRADAEETTPLETRRWQSMLSFLSWSSNPFLVIVLPSYRCNYLSLEY